MEKKTKELTRDVKPEGKNSVYMEIDSKLKWTFFASNAFEAIEKGKRICKDNGKNFHKDVKVFEITQREA